jgi:sigma-E factor negative regulatory protein RseB
MKRAIAVQRALVVLLCGVGALLALPAAANDCSDSDPEALAWLDRMSRNTQQVAHKGVITFQRGDDLQVMQLSHRVAGPAVSEQMTRLTGQGAQVVRDNHPLNCIHPGHLLLQLGSELAEGECGIASHYRLGMADGERVAGRSTVRITVSPRDMYRYGYQLELDRQTALLLKASTVGRGNKVLERFQYADVAYNDGGAGDPEVEIVHHAAHPEPGRPAVGIGVPWGLRWLPSGFLATDETAADSARRTYTDGLAVFSVFLERLAATMPSGEGVVRQGSTTSYTRGIQLEGQPVLVTVIGEVPVNTARMVADSVSRVR